MAHAHDYPQWLNLTQLPANSATFVQTETQLNPPTHQHVLEVCKVETRVSNLLAVGLGPGAAGADIDATVQTQITRTSQTGIIDLNDPDMVSRRDEEYQIVAMEATETGAGFLVKQGVQIADYTVGDKGFLVAAQSLFYSVDITGGLAHTRNLEARVLARWVKVDLTQLIEMVLQ